jgi:hypothetical protein
MPVQTYPDVPKDEAGAKKVTVTPNDDGESCTVVVKT